MYQATGEGMGSNVPYIVIEGLEKSKAPSLVQSRGLLSMAFRKKFGVTILSLQICFIILFAFFVEYGQQVDANQDKYPPNERVDPDEKKFHAVYPMFQDVNAIIFIGVGFLYTFLKKYGYMGVGMNMLLAAIAVQWSIFTHNWWTTTDGKIHIDIKTMITAEFAAASVVISLGAIFGKTNPLQMVAFTLIETFIYTTNEHYCLTLLKVSDIGGSVSLHLFAATFGLAVAYTVDKKLSVQDNLNEEPSYNSNLFCMLGTVLLWCFWPSFNAALLEGDAQHRAALNTYMAFLSGCITAFAASSLFDKNGKFTMSQIQNATLAGGVAIGATCDLMIHPFGALLIGGLGGILCVFGFNYLGPFLARIKIYDPCAINSLHGLPGFFSGITSIVMALFATIQNYGHSLYRIYPAMAPPQNTSELFEIQQKYQDVLAGEGRTPAFQACYQLLYMIEVLTIAIVTGLLTGIFLRSKIFDRLEEKQMYLDEPFWNLPGSKPNSNDSINSGLSDTKM